MSNVEKIFCKYCKIPINQNFKIELELNYHLSCKHEVDLFREREKTQFDTFVKLYGNMLEHTGEYSHSKLTESIQELNMINLGLETLSDSIGTFKILDLLRLGKNSLSDLPSTLPPTLILLWLNENKFRTIPKVITTLTDLLDLDISQNKLIEIPSTISNLTDLMSLNADGNELTDIPSLEALTSLKFLNLSNNQIHQFPKELTSVHSLEYLYLNSNKITSIPGSLGNLVFLHKLNLANNQLTTLPETLGNLKNLRELDIRDNPIRQLPENLWKTNLKTLYADGTRLERLPDDIGNTKIREFHLRGTNITELPDFNPSNKPNKIIEILDIRDTPLEDIPDSISKLQNINRIYVSNEALGKKFLKNNLVKDKVYWPRNSQDINLLKGMPKISQKTNL